MNADNYNTVLRDISLSARTFRVFVRSRKEPTYKTSTLSKPSQFMINELVDMFTHEPAIRITENGKEVYVRYEKQSSPSSFMDMHRGYLGIYEVRSKKIHDTVEMCAESNGIEVDTVIASLRNAERGLKSRFKILK